MISECGFGGGMSRTSIAPNPTSVIHRAISVFACADPSLLISIMSALWLGAATILALQAHGNEKVSTKVPAVSGHTFSYLDIMSNAHLDNLPIQ